MSTRRTIYLPDAVSERFERAATRHQLNASEFHQRAGVKYADELEAADLTRQINEALDEIGEQHATNPGPAIARIAVGDWR